MMAAEQQGGRFPRLLQAAIDAFSLPDLRAKILFTLAILALYRFIAHIPLPRYRPGTAGQPVPEQRASGFSGPVQRWRTQPDEHRRAGCISHTSRPPLSSSC